MAKINYAHAKRQRDIAKKQKLEAKRQKKTSPGDAPSEETPVQPPPPPEQKPEE